MPKADSRPTVEAADAEDDHGAAVIASATSSPPGDAKRRRTPASPEHTSSCIARPRVLQATVRHTGGRDE